MEENNGRPGGLSSLRDGAAGASPPEASIPDADFEITMVEMAFRALAPLDQEGRKRAVDYLASRLALAVGHNPKPIICRERRAVEAVGNAMGVAYGEMTGHSRKNHLCRGRYAVMQAMKLEGFSLKETARALGGRDHTTVISGLKRAEELLDSDPDFPLLVMAAHKELITTDSPGG